MGRTEAINRLLFEFDLLSEDEIARLISDLPRKIVRWLAINHPDNRIRKIFYRATGVRIREGTVINPGVIIEDCCRSLGKIGERVSVAAGVVLIADTAPNNSRLAQVPYVRDHLIVEKEVWKTMPGSVPPQSFCPVLPSVAVPSLEPLPSSPAASPQPPS